MFWISNFEDNKSFLSLFKVFQNSKCSKIGPTIKKFWIILIFFSLRSTERLFISKWGRISPVGAALNLFWGHIYYFSGGIRTFPLLSVTWARAPVAVFAIFQVFTNFFLQNFVMNHKEIYSRLKEVTWSMSNLGYI